MCIRGSPNCCRTLYLRILAMQQCNSRLSVTSARNIDRLQRLLNAAAGWCIFHRGQKTCRCETQTQSWRVGNCQGSCNNMECVTNNCVVQNHHKTVQGCINNSPIYFDLHRLMADMFVYLLLLFLLLIYSYVDPVNAERTFKASHSPW